MFPNIRNWLRWISTALLHNLIMEVVARITVRIHPEILDRYQDRQARLHHPLYSSITRNRSLRLNPSTRCSPLQVHQDIASPDPPTIHMMALKEWSLLLPSLLRVPHLELIIQGNLLRLLPLIIILRLMDPLRDMAADLDPTHPTMPIQPFLLLRSPPTLASLMSAQMPVPLPKEETMGLGIAERGVT